MKKKFTYYLHDDCDTMERIHNIEQEVGPLTSHQKDNLGRPFYEVGLECEINENGDVTILGIKK